MIRTGNLKVKPISVVVVTSHMRCRELISSNMCCGYPLKRSMSSKEEVSTSHTTHHNNNNNNNNSNNNNNTDWLYFQIPYISDAVDYKIKTIFKEEGPQVRITHKSTTLRQILKPKNDNLSSCKQAECAASKENLCLTRNVVNQITCNECHQSYIGSTIRRTHDCIKEHLSRPTSSLYKHFANLHNTENLENSRTEYQ